MEVYVLVLRTNQLCPFRFPFSLWDRRLPNHLSVSATVPRVVYSKKCQEQAAPAPFATTSLPRAAPCHGGETATTAAFMAR